MTYQYVSLYRQTLAERQTRYNAAIASGQSTPFLYPWDTLPALYLLIAIAVTPRIPPARAKAIRYISFLLVLLHSAYIVSHRRTLSFASGYMVGIANAWGVIMSAALLVFNDVAKDFNRLETRPVELAGTGSCQDGVVATSAVDLASSIDLTMRKVPGLSSSMGTKQLSSVRADKLSTRPYKLVWQGYPLRSDWSHVVDWAADLITNFRGVNWNHRIPTLGKVDAPVPSMPQKQTSTVSVEAESRPTAVPPQTLRSLQLRSLQYFSVTYVLLDFLKTTMMTDPYFLGLEPLESPTPWPWLARLNHHIPVATRCVRLLTSMAGVVTALTFIFTLSPLFFASILPAFMDVSKITRSPLLEPCMYPPQWHPLAESLFHSGLAGFWGNFWHQMFRFGFSEPSRVLIERLDIERRGDAARTIQLVVAFFLSGSIHAAGSYTTFSLETSHPFSGSFLFFFAQGCGILLQSWLVRLIFQYVPQIKSLPQVVRQTTNLVFAGLYLYFTGPLLTSDIARCGVWLFEPVPISPLRGLGWGPGGKDEGWWAWYQEGSKWIGWWPGDHWWQRGMAIY
ncbi:hypothetical protein A1O3_02100 [Capronia epimyces CBS 606.96]|uniref:Wax synthase domain-containing protein n=1 Tax=Capronia epimyces CBS 606.96 TaxID=1182542 RepID=W9YIF5_9EURO|nr:uncharacterized protein A1O3_02100 [Capronia epimyces CBS 606.96]EXJ89036.1 hypothetical protein A1O3_02100 [Capronia epimyces CBS 606.96]